MSECEMMQALLDKFEAAGNEEAAEGIRQAMSAAGCGVQAESGGTGNGPPQPGGGFGGG